MKSTSGGAFLIVGLMILCVSIFIIATNENRYISSATLSAFVGLIVGGILAVVGIVKGRSLKLTDD